MVRFSLKWTPQVLALSTIPTSPLHNGSLRILFAKLKSLHKILNYTCEQIELIKFIWKSN